MNERGRLGYTSAVAIQGGYDCGVVGNDIFQVCNYGMRIDSAATDPNTLWPMAGNKFLHNIVYYKNPSAWLYRYSRNDVPDQNESDYNLIWHFGLPLNVGLAGVTPDKQWEEWQKKGFDVHSVVADPLFVDAAKDDYRLKPDSPAFKLGFKPIPVEKIGPYASPLRASWPIVEAPGVRETPIPEIKVDLPPQPIRKRPRTTVPRVAKAPVVDGVAEPGEWSASPLILRENPDGSVLKSAPCEARLAMTTQTFTYLSPCRRETRRS